MEWNSTAPLWPLTNAAAGGLLGGLAVWDRRWALLPGLSTAAVFGTGLTGRLQGLLPISSDLIRTASAVGLGLLALWGVSRIPALPWRVPVVVTLCFWLGLGLFFLIFKIP